MSSTPPGKFQLNTCPAMPLRRLRRLRGGGKALAPLRTHQPETWRPATLFEGECDPWKPLNQGRRTPRGLPRRLRRAREPLPHTPRLWTESHRLTALVPLRQPHSLPSARAANNHLCHYGREKSTTEGAGRLKAGSPSLKSGSATARTLHRLDRPPVSPLPWPKKFPTPLPKTVFFR